MRHDIQLIDKFCLCGSRRKASECCLPLISGADKARDPEQLMRSRYSAYCLVEADYLLQTWHYTTRPQQLTLEDELNWTGLNVLKVVEPALVSAEMTGFVEFVASYRCAGKAGKMHERSRFQLLDGDWYYVDGVQIPVDVPQPMSKAGRNDPCPCGSGKKYKKCCG